MNDLSFTDAFHVLVIKAIKTHSHETSMNIEIHQKP